MMIPVTIKPFIHRNQEHIGVYFENYGSLNNIIRKLPEARWSQTQKCWYFPLTEEAYRKICDALKGRADLNITELKSFLESRKKPGNLQTGISKASRAFVRTPGIIQKKEVVPVKKSVAPGPQIARVNAHVIPDMKQSLILKAYSSSTIKTYLNEVGQFLQAIKNNAADELEADRIKSYLQYCFDQLKLSENTLHSRMNALKFYYEQVLRREKFFWDIPRPKKPMILPKLLNETELRNLFNALTNKKHKAMLFTAYSAGLRVSEIVNLKIADIDSRRMQIFIERAKGKKDRYVNLSPVLLDILRNYIQDYVPRPRVYLFESEQTMGPYPIRTVQQIFTNAKRKAKIGKSVGIHSLRHSFATHLLDKGTDIKYIKDLLGHFNIKTTERYLHISKKQLVNIVSPFDDLWKNEQIDW